MDTQENIHNIIDYELHYHFSKSGGPGWQHVNKTESKAELYFNIQNSQYLTPKQKERLIALAGNKVHHEENILIMTCQEERFQRANKEKVIQYFTELIMKAIIEPKKRLSTKLPKAEREARLLAKKHTSTIKHLRQTPKWDE